MKLGMLSYALLMAAALAPSPARAQQTSGSTVKTTVDEVLLDLIVRDKKGKPVTDLKPADITVLDNGAKQTLTLLSPGQRLRSHQHEWREDRARPAAASAARDPGLRGDGRSRPAQVGAYRRTRSHQRRPAGTNVFYAVVAINTQLIVLQQFTRDKAALTKAIEHATGGLGGPGMASESDAILAELKRNLAARTAQSGTDVLAAASQTASQPVAERLSGTGCETGVRHARHAAHGCAVTAQGTRLTLTALRALVEGQRSIPGRKSVIYFTSGMYLTPELDVPFRNLMSTANRDNVTFYSVDTRGVMVSAQNSGARNQLNGAAHASETTVRLDGTAAQSNSTTVNSREKAVDKDEIMAADNAETAGRKPTCRNRSATSPSPPAAF